jgi:hypothetical protein
MRCETPSIISAISTIAEWPTEPILFSVTMDSNLIHFARKHQLRIGGRLGFGIHGSVFTASRVKPNWVTAVKVFKDVDFFLREFAVYERLSEYEVKNVHGFNVPEMLRADEELLVIEMTIVPRPFILDFAGAYVDVRPTFSEEIWANWEEEKRDQYGARWPQVRKVLDAFEEMDIFILDVSPTNIAFRD